MLKIFLLFLLSISAFAADGFEISFGNSHKSEIPTWVANPVEDDTNYIYGIGSGNSLPKAEQSALSNISQKLATVVSSNVSSYVSDNQGKVNASYSQEISAKTFDTKITNYEVVKSASQGDIFYSMVRMSRSSFVKDTMDRLSAIDDRLTNKVKQASNVSKVQQYVALLEIHPDIIEATSLVFLLQSASGSFDSTKYFSKYSKYQSLADELLYQLRFKIEFSPEFAYVGEMVINLLGEAKLSAAPDEHQADATIKIKAITTRSFLFNEYTTQLRVTFQTVDKSGRKVNSKEYIVAGSSMTSYDNSMRTAVQLLQNKLQDDGILTTIGLQKPAQS